MNRPGIMLAFSTVLFSSFALARTVAEESANPNIKILTYQLNVLQASSAADSDVDPILAAYDLHELNRVAGDTRFRIKRIDFPRGAARCEVDAHFKSSVTQLSSDRAHAALLASARKECLQAINWSNDDQTVSDEVKAEYFVCKTENLSDSFSGTVWGSRNEIARLSFDPHANIVCDRQAIEAAADETSAPHKMIRETARRAHSETILSALEEAKALETRRAEELIAWLTNSYNARFAQYSSLADVTQKLSACRKRMRVAEKVWTKMKASIAESQCEAVTNDLATRMAALHKEVRSKAPINWNVEALRADTDNYFGTWNTNNFQSFQSRELSYETLRSIESRCRVELDACYNGSMIGNAVDYWKKQVAK